MTDDAFTLFNEGVTASMQAQQHRASGAIEAAVQCDRNALDSFEQTLELQPDHLGALGGKAMCQAQLGETQQAIDTFNAAIEVEPVPEFYRQLGLCHTELGDMQQAWIATRQAISLDDSAETRQNASWELQRFGTNVESIIEAHAAEMTQDQLAQYHRWAASIFALACETDPQSADAQSSLQRVEGKLAELEGGAG